MQKGCVNRQIACLPITITKFPFRFMKKMKKTWPIFAVALIDVDPRLDLIDLIDLDDLIDDLRWVLVSNYRPFRPTRSTSRVIAENRFFNLFLFAGDGRIISAVCRPSTAGRPPVDHFVSTISTTISSPQQQDRYVL